MIRLTKTSGPNINKMLEDLPRRIKNVGREVGRAFSEQIAAEVKRRLGGRKGWVKIYRDAIIYKESPSGDSWAVAGLDDQHPNLFEFPAETSLLYFAGNGRGNIPAGNNPWPIDVIPPLKEGYDDTARVEMHDPGTVENYRQARMLNLPGVIDALNEVGSVDTSGDTLVMIDKVYADIAWLARRLELGFQGYPRVPHWGPAASAASSQGDKWVSTSLVHIAVDNALQGAESAEVPQMSKAEADELARIREATWS
jgi:hypothetical protein